ncbi:Ldh family oxidoreductase [Nonomuraea helvata]|uniref:Ldh family oxidoreductase n=1 Tax=Nonomuraea helvata TaxID=37484 RepID=A0ABV5SAE0_9ACTN
MADAYLDLLYSYGLTAAEAAATLRALTFGERSGTTSHGLRRLTRGFVQDVLDAGLCEPGVEPVYHGERNGLLCWDARGGIGYYALEKVLTTVLGERRDSFVLQIANLYPTNTLAQPAELLCEAGYLCFLASRSPARVIGPVGGREVVHAAPVIGTNAQAWGCPGAEGEHVVFDGSLAAMTNGDVLTGSRPFDESAFLTTAHARARTPSDVFTDSGFRGFVRPMGGGGDHKGFGVLLAAEMLHWLGNDGSPGSTFVMAIRPPDPAAFEAARQAFEERYRRSLRFADGGPPRLPHERARAARRGTTDDGVLAELAGELPPVPERTRSLLRVRLPAGAPSVIAPSGRAIPAGTPAAGLLDLLARENRVSARAARFPEDVADLEPGGLAYTDPAGMAARCAWLPLERSRLDAVLTDGLLRAAPQASWVVPAGSAPSSAQSPVRPAVVMIEPDDAGRLPEISGRFPGSLVGVLGEEPVLGADVVVFPSGEGTLDLEAVALPQPYDGRSPGSHRAARLREVLERVLADTGLDLSLAELTRLATGETQPGRQFFDSWAREGYALPSLSQHAQLLEACIGTMAFEPGHRVLDLGCGDGKLAVRLPEVAQLDLLDLSKEMLDRIPLERLRAGTVRRLHTSFSQWTGTGYDRLAAIMSMHHFDHDEIGRVLTSCRARLGSGGRMFLGESFLDTHDLAAPGVIDRICDVYLRKIVNAARQGCLPHAVRDVQIMGRVLRGEGEHMRTRLQWRALLEDSGFRVVEERTTAPEIMYGYLVAEPA